MQNYATRIIETKLIGGTNPLRTVTVNFRELHNFWEEQNL